ncbi:toxin HigB-2 [Betaproteobacteria bacterium]|nr:toxin HigB-2 [Betaproteobacteria bacterium]
MVFIELTPFRRFITLSDEELRQLQNDIMKNPDAGERLRGGRGLRKIRIPWSGHGKSGGARVIYYLKISDARCYLLLAYSKNVMDNLTPAQLLELVQALLEED